MEDLVKNTTLRLIQPSIEIGILLLLQGLHFSGSLIWKPVYTLSVTMLQPSTV